MRRNYESIVLLVQQLVQLDSTDQKNNDKIQVLMNDLAHELESFKKLCIISGMLFACVLNIFLFLVLSLSL